MHKSLVVLAFFGTISACAAQPAAPVQSAPAAGTAQQADTDKARECEEFEAESTGTRLGTERICRPAPAAKENPPSH